MSITLPKIAPSLGIGAPPGESVIVPAKTDRPDRYHAIAGSASPAIPGPWWRDVGYGSALLATRTEASLRLPRKVPDHVELHVSSTSALKVQAATDFVIRTMRTLDPSFDARRVKVVTYKTSSGVPEQPIGRAAGTLGAQTRASDAAIRAAVAEAQTAGRTAFVVSIENTISIEPRALRTMPRSWSDRYSGQYVRDGAMAIDLAAIHVELAAPNLGVQKLDIWGDGVTLPFHFVDEARSSGASEHGFAVTCGTFIARDTGLPDNDWHLGFVGETRASILTRALAGVRPQLARVPVGTRVADAD